MKKILVNKEMLSGYKSVMIGFENCDTYEVAVEDILVLYCEAELIDGKRNEYYTNDGFIKISEKASQTAERYVLQNNENGSYCGKRLKDRLRTCSDVTSFSMVVDGEREVNIYVPYDPLEGVLHGNEIELSNCPSFEVDNEGNMIIAFGERSKQPKRKDNNYAELIEGWSDAFGDFQPKILKVKAKKIDRFGDKQTNFCLYIELCDKKPKKRFAELVFKDCKRISIEAFFPLKGNCEIAMSKMADGQIYVGFDGLGMDFVCSSIQEYDYYCAQLGNDE